MVLQIFLLLWLWWQVLSSAVISPKHHLFIYFKYAYVPSLSLSIHKKIIEEKSSVSDKPYHRSHLH